MRTAGATILLTLLLVRSGQAQLVYDTTPEWVSTDTPVSTGGALVDLDRDGWLDFVVANGNDMQRQQLVVYYNTGAGGFPATPDWSSGDAEYNGHISVADVNGDGWLDVAVGLTWEDLGAPTARLYLNNGGALSSLPDWESPDELAAFHVSFGDVNADGRPDLAVGTGWPYWDPHTWPTHVYFNIDGALEPTPSWVSDDTWDYGDVFFCDVNGDGWLDLVGTGEATDTWVYVNNQGTLATTATWHTTDNPDQDVVMGTYGDVDGDGWFELFMTDNIQLGGSGDIRRYDGLIGGFFTTTPTWSHFEGYGSAVALADIDADGDLDMATGSWWGYTHYFMNTGGLYPSGPDWESVGDSVVEAIVFGDVNNDGLRFATEVFDAASSPSGHLFHVAHQPIQYIESVSVDDTPLGPHEFTFDLVHGWVSVGPTPSSAVTVQYVYSLKPDMAITNWDAQGNQLYYNHNAVPSGGDFDDDGDVDADDFAEFELCYTGLGGGPVSPGCEPGDFDNDDDVDCEDWRRFTLAWSGPGDPPLFVECPCHPVAPPELEAPEVMAKNRAISLVPGNPGRLTALRVTLSSLPQVFAGLEGQTMWVSLPTDVTEHSANSGSTPSPTFRAARLVCDPVLHDWGSEGLVHVLSNAIVPGASYSIDAIVGGCNLSEELDYSAPLTVVTSPDWGDLVGDCGAPPCTPPDGRIDFIDITAVVEKFKNLPGAVIKARADLAGNIPDLVVDFVDISSCVDAFRGDPYPFDGPPDCSATK